MSHGAAFHRVAQRIGARHAIGALILFGCSPSDYQISVSVQPSTISASTESVAVVAATVSTAKDAGVPFGLCLRMTSEIGSIACPGGACGLATIAGADGGLINDCVPPKCAYVPLSVGGTGLGIYHATSAGNDVVTVDLFLTEDCPPRQVVDVTAAAFGSIAVTPADAGVPERD